MIRPVPSKCDLDTRAQIHDLVIHFYREVALDDLLAPVFGEVAEVDWATHIPRLIDYWSQVLLGERGYDGAMLAAHRSVHDLEPFRVELFDRWYRLFVESVDGRWAGPKADAAKAHAARTASILARRLVGVDWTPEDCMRAHGSLGFLHEHRLDPQAHGAAGG
jgi:hemoglobin